MSPLLVASLVAGWAPVVPPSVACLVDLLGLFSTLSKAEEDLKKTTVVVESLSTTSTRCSVPQITSLLQDKTR